MSAPDPWTPGGGGLIEITPVKVGARVEWTWACTDDRHADEHDDPDECECGGFGTGRVDTIDGESGEITIDVDTDRGPGSQYLCVPSGDSLQVTS